MTAVLADTVAVCWDCGGPCLTYKGSKHGWRCRACVDRYLDEAAAKADAYDRRNREQRIAKGHNTVTAYHSGGTDMTPISAADGRRRDGGMASGLAVSTSTCHDDREDTDR